jgi:hypothetical protein
MKRDLSKPLAPTYGDEPKKKKYTASDSIAHTRLEKKIDKNILENKRLSGSKGEMKRLGVIDSQVKKLRENPFHETYAERKYGKGKKK